MNTMQTAPPNISFGGSIPQNYDQYLGPFLFEPYARDLVARIDRNDGRVLELACGTGRVTAHLVKKMNKASLTVTDINPDMLSIAREKVKDSNIDWQTADMMELPFKNEEFDVVVCQYGIMFVPDKSKAMSEIYRVLKSGGYFHFNTWDNLDNNPVPNAVITAFRKTLSGEEGQFFDIPFSMYDPQELERLLKESGFFDIRIERVKKEGEAASAADLSEGFLMGTPAYNAIMEHRPGSLQKIKEDVKTAVEAVAGNKQIRTPLNAWVCSARKMTK